MPKMNGGTPPLSDYARVADRISLFYEQHPGGRIITALHTRTDEEVVFVARVYRNAGDREPSATGWACEREGDGEINIAACLENTETSAVGRALANLGFTASSRRPSREEMEKAMRARARLRRDPAYPLKPAREGDRSAAPAEFALLQARADAVADLLAVLRAAQQCGLRSRRAEWIDARVRAGQTSAAALDRLGRRLRRWIAASAERRIAGFSDPDRG